MICDRCRTETVGSTGSIFNTQQICLGCAETERAHPGYEEAARRENEAVRRGDFNFLGVGLPAGYAEWARERQEAS